MITVFGSASLDLIGKVTRFPEPGETVPGGEFSTSPGGKGANQALAARRAGADVRLCCRVGTDAFAAEAMALLRGDGVDLSAVHPTEGRTGIAMIFVDAHGENVIAILPGANGKVTVADADAALHGLGIGSILLLQQEVPQAATERALELAARQGVVSILNTAPFLPSTRGVAEKAAIVVANETEFALLTGSDGGSLSAAMDNWARELNQTIIVTLGKDGARAATPTGGFAVPSLAIEPVDTVGAGDTFCGYLAAGLDAGLDLEAAMRRAAVAGSLACLKPGAQPAIPWRNEAEDPQLL